MRRPAASLRERAAKQPGSRRGIASVLAMMFLVMFGSLVAAMAIASKGNIKTAATHLHVMRAMSAAETGMAFAEQRFMEAANRFIVSESDIDAAMNWALWTGDSAAIGIHQVIDPPSGFIELTPPTGIAQALANRHDADQNIVVGAEFVTSSVVGSAPADVDLAVYAVDSWVYTPAVLLGAVDPVTGALPPAFQVRYAPLAGGEFVRIVVDGLVFNYGRNNEPIRRTITRDIRLVKRIDHAVVTHTRVMIGKNVIIEGGLAARYEEVTFTNGDPVLLRSDFMGMDPVLDAKITEFYLAIDAADVDGDNRLRIGHPVEGAVIPVDSDFDGDGELDGAFLDATGDGFLDEMDIFIRHYDADGDGRVTLSAALIVGTKAEINGSAPEFTDDEDLAYLLDSSKPDRNRNGIYGYVDLNINGRYDPATETLNDFDAELGVFADEELGYRDGYIDVMDMYAKVSGQIKFSIGADAWIAAQGSYRPKMRGPIIPNDDSAPLSFGVGDSIPFLTASSFADTENALMAAADGDSFWNQVAGQLGTDLASLLVWTEANNSGAVGDPYLIAMWPDLNLDGLPDNSAVAYFEKSPFRSPLAADLYYRPVFRNFVFRNCQIPMGLNGLFEDCTFVGITYVRSQTLNDHPLWTEYGKMVPDLAGRPIPKHDRFIYGDDGDEPDNNAPQSLPATARPPVQMVEMTTPDISPLDRGDVLEDDIALYAGSYGLLPDALIIGGRRVVDTKAYSNNVRFHDCLFVGSIVADTPVRYTQVRNKLQFTGATRFSMVHPDEPENGFLNPDADDMVEIAKSSMMAPNYSVDIGTFNSPPEQNVQLQGAIVAGVLDARGNTEIFGTLLLTFDPVYGTAPLVDPYGTPIGNPAGYNVTLGYFGEDTGDFESIDPNTLPEFGGVKIVGWDIDGDGIADLPHTAPQPAGSTAVPFWGFGRVVLRHNPELTLPSGIMLPLKAIAVPGSYREGGL